MTIQLTQIEYNTEALGGTFDRISWVDPMAFGKVNAPEAIEVDALALERAVITSLRRFEDDLVAKLSEKAINRVLTLGRWTRIGPAELICEVMTDKSIRKGSLNEEGRHSRARQISDAISAHSKVEFAILLLPFRTASPLKNRGTLPDLGELYTLVSLHALARACHKSQAQLVNLIKNMNEGVGEVARDCAEIAAIGEGDDLSDLFAQAIKECSHVSAKTKICAVARKRLRQMEAARSEVHVRDPVTFLGFANLLAYYCVCP